MFAKRICKTSAIAHIHYKMQTEKVQDLRFSQWWESAVNSPNYIRKVKLIHPQHKCILLNNSVSSCILWWAKGNARGQKLISFMTLMGKTKTVHYKLYSSIMYLQNMWRIYSGTFMASHRVGDSEAIYQEILATRKW